MDANHYEVADGRKMIMAFGQGNEDKESICMCGLISDVLKIQNKGSGYLPQASVEQFEIA